MENDYHVEGIAYPSGFPVPKDAPLFRVLQKGAADYRPLFQGTEEQCLDFAEAMNAAKYRRQHSTKVTP